MQCLITALLVTSSFAQETRLEADLPAQWITMPGVADNSNGVFSFRKSLSISGLIAPYIVHVSGDNRFILYVNGTRVGDGPARGDVSHWRYETLDIAPQLHEGVNLISARVWNFGDLSPVAQLSLRSGFILWSDSTQQNEIHTDASWEARAESGWTYRPTGPPVNSNVGPNETIDGRQYDWRWNDPADTTGWMPAVAIGPPVFERKPGLTSSAAAWILTADKLPKMQYTEQSAGEVVRSSGAQSSDFPSGPAVVQAHSHASFLIDRKVLTTAYPELTVSGGSGATIRLTYAEALFDTHGEKGNRSDIVDKHMDPRMLHDDFILDGGSNRTFEPLWWRTWRYLQIDVDTQSEPVSLQSLRAHYTAYPFQEKAYFRSDDPSLTKIWEIGWRTSQLDAHETYMDCPYWEQLQYIGDTRIEALISYVATGDDRLALQSLHAFAESLQKSGLTESRYPTRAVQVIPPFSLLWIGMLHDYWMYRPDQETVKAMLPATRTILQYFEGFQRNDGLLGKMPNQGYELWSFVDWTDQWKMGVPPEDADGGSITLSLQLVNAYRDAADLEQALGDSANATKYRMEATVIAKVAYAKGWDSKQGLLSDVPSHASYSQQTNILGVLSDAIPRGEQQKVLEHVLQQERKNDEVPSSSNNLALASYYFRFYLSRAIDHAGMDDNYLETLGPWHKMLQLGLSTWAETPEPTRSDAHAWSAHPNYDLLTLVAGIKSDAPGFGRVLISPHMGNLHTLEAELAHPDGPIFVSYSRSGDSLRARIQLPRGLAGTFEVNGHRRPLHSGKQEFQVPLK